MKGVRKDGVPGRAKRGPCFLHQINSTPLTCWLHMGLSQGQRLHEDSSLNRRVYMSLEKLSGLSVASSQSQRRTPRYDILDRTISDDFRALSVSGRFKVGVTDGAF